MLIAEENTKNEMQIVFRNEGTLINQAIRKNIRQKSWMECKIKKNLYNFED